MGRAHKMDVVMRVPASPITRSDHLHTDVNFAKSDEEFRKRLILKYVQGSIEGNTEEK